MTQQVLLHELQYDLPPELIAQQPAQPRDASRLMVLDRTSGTITHRIFRDIHEYLRPGDCLVRNNTRVIPARFFCRRRTGGKVEALFLREDGDAWRVLLRPSARLSAGERILCEPADTATDAVQIELIERRDDGEWRVRPLPGMAPRDLLTRIGVTPLPPYIRRDPLPSASDAERYQTVYAARDGAVAAPTAGLHFTRELLDQLAAAGVRVCDVTLHVGLGTFAPVKEDDLRRHRMHAEWYDVGRDAVGAIDATKAAGGRIVAVGTTSARTLESFGEADIRPARGITNLFIQPPYRFAHVDALLTNFHLPASTLLALVMAFAGVDLTRRAYQQAVAQRYRFYSYGDAMLIV